MNLCWYELLYACCKQCLRNRSFHERGTGFMKIFEGIRNSKKVLSLVNIFIGYFQILIENLRTILMGLQHLNHFSWTRLHLLCFYFLFVFRCCRLEKCNFKWLFKETFNNSHLPISWKDIFLFTFLSKTSRNRIRIVSTSVWLTIFLFYSFNSRHFFQRKVQSSRENSE